MILQLIGLVVMVSLIVAGVIWVGKNVRFGSSGKDEKTVDEKEVK